MCIVREWQSYGGRVLCKEWFFVWIYMSEVCRSVCWCINVHVFVNICVCERERECERRRIYYLVYVFLCKRKFISILVGLHLSVRGEQLVCLCERTYSIIFYMWKTVNIIVYVFKWIGIVYWLFCSFVGACEFKLLCVW